jgi:hypothetical protein
LSAPLVVTIPHNLGQAEATRRLQAGLGSVGHDFGSVLTVEEQRWTDNVLSFRVRAVGQTVTGTVHVLEQDVRLELDLPWLLRQIADRFLPRIKQQATILLGKPTDKA